MNNSTILKSFVLSVALALCVNVASAQKTKKTNKNQVETRVSDKATIDATAQVPEYKWVYSVATVINEGKSYNIKFEESENKAREASMERSKEMSQKMQEIAKMVTSETDLLNLLAQQNLEIISVTNVAEREGKAMKYYLRQKVKK